MATCVTCGRAPGADAALPRDADESGPGDAVPPLTWTAQVTARGTQWLCDLCTRQNLRSIEGRLDEAWW